MQSNAPSKAVRRRKREQFFSLPQPVTSAMEQFFPVFKDSCILKSLIVTICRY